MSERYVLGELERMISNLIQLGTVVSFNPYATPPTVLVDLGEQITDPIPISMGRAGSTKEWNPPAIGEQVLIFNPCGDVALAVSLGGIFQSAFPQPSNSSSQNVLQFPDGSTVIHDSGSGTYTINVNSGNVTINCGNATINASQKTTINSPDTTISGNVTVGGSITAGGDINDQGGSFSMSGMRSTYNSHIHPCPDGNTNVPNQKMAV